MAALFAAVTIIEVFFEHGISEATLETAGQGLGIISAMFFSVWAAGKAFRDLDSSKSDERREKLISSIGDVAFAVYDAGDATDVPPLDNETPDKHADKRKPDFFARLIEITFTYVEAYYRQTQDQANRSFALCAMAAVISFGVMIGGVLAMFQGKATAAAVCAASGAFGEFIAAVFFWLYNRTVLAMAQYHQKLIITQNVSLALKITELLPEAERVKAQTDLIHELSKDINKYLSPSPLAEKPARRRTPAT
jgi:hypothetical protein